MIKRRLKSFINAFNGLRSFFKSETNAKIHLAAAFVAIALGFFFEINYWEWGLVTLSIAMVIGAEAMNTAIETLTNLVSPDYHELAGKTKDIAAAAVLVTAFGALVIGGIVFLPKIWSYFFS